MILGYLHHTVAFICELSQISHTCLPRWPTEDLTLVDTDVHSQIGFIDLKIDVESNSRLRIFCFGLPQSETGGARQASVKKSHERHTEPSAGGMETWRALS